MADLVDIRENYFVAGDYDSRKRYLRAKSNGDLAVCSGVTWTSGGARNVDGQPAVSWRWSIPGRGSEVFSLPASPPAASPSRTTRCTI